MRNGTKYDLAGCDGCKFLSTEYGWCNYGDITGRTRLAQGAVLLECGGCVLKEIGKTKYRPRDLPRFGYVREKTFTQKRLEAIWRVMTALYEQGLSDAQIGNEVGKTKAAVQAWRKRRGLPANCEPGSGKKIPRGKDNG